MQSYELPGKIFIINYSEMQQIESLELIKEI